jgi:hypothetical protein
VFSLIWYLLWNYGEELSERESLQDLEGEFQVTLDRIANAHRGMVRGRVSDVKSIDGDDYSYDATQPVMTNLLHDGTISQEMEKLDSAANRVGQRLAGMRETANSRISLTDLLTTVVITVLLLLFAALSFVVTALSIFLT